MEKKSYHQVYPLISNESQLTIIQYRIFVWYFMFTEGFHMYYLRYPLSKPCEVSIAGI